MSRFRTAYFIAANTAILWLLLESGAHLAVRTYEWARPPFGDNELWRDFSRLRVRYAPIVGFVEDSFTSRSINVDARGVRSNGNGQHPLDGAIWFFGGSAAFGEGVADRETIPAQLERMLGKPVINFGARGHYSVIETRLLNHYLRIGFRPSAAWFLDGVNESCEPDLAEDELGQVVDRSQRGYRWDVSRPVVYAISRVRSRAASDTTHRSKLVCRAAGQDNPLAAVHARALKERAALCALYNIECHTFIEPFPDDDLRELSAHLEPVWRQAQHVTFVQAAFDRLDLIAAAIAATPWQIGAP